MALIPETDFTTIGDDVEIESAADQTSRTYHADFETGRVAGFVERTDAMKQAIFKILETERFKYLIYSWNYGIEMNSVVGKSFNVIASEIKRLIKEALLADSRITAVTDFSVEQTSRNSAHVSFTAKTIFGDVNAEKDVSFDV